jgi:hypothetical protein
MCDECTDWVYNFKYAYCSCIAVFDSYTGLVLKEDVSHGILQELHTITRMRH